MLKKTAYAETRYLLSRGLIAGPERGCSRCDSTEYALQSHHADYKRPRIIQWLCPKCHTRAHEPAEEKRREVPPKPPGGLSSDGDRSKAGKVIIEDILAGRITRDEGHAKLRGLGLTAP